MPSSVIRWFNYDPAKHELHVVFQSGRRYTYQNVPEQTFQAMKASFSKGEFFNTHIRDRFPFVRKPSP
jgi:KTSC domain